MPHKNFYSYHPDTPLRIGRSFDPSAPDVLKRQCLDFDDEIVDPGSSWTSIEATLIQSEEQLLRVIGVDLSLEAHYLVFGSKVNFNYSASTDSQHRGLSLVLTARTDFGRVYMKKPRLSEDATKLLSQKEKFKSVYGTHYVLAEERGASLSIVLGLDQFEETTKRKIVGSVDAKGGFGPLSAELKASISDELNKKFSESKVTLSVYATGGDGFTALGELVKSSLASGSKLDDMLNGLQTALKSYDSKQGASLGYFIGDLAQFGLDTDSSDLINEERETRLLQIAKDYQTSRQRLALTRRLLSSDDARGQILLPEQVAQLKQIDAEYLAFGEKARAAYVKLMNGEIVDLPPMTATNDSLRALLAPTVTVRVDDVVTGVRLNPTDSMKKIVKEGWPNVPSYMFVQGLDVAKIRIFYRDATRTEETTLLATESTPPPVDDKGAGTLIRGYSIGNEFGIWNRAVAPLRKYPVGGSTRERGTGTFWIQVEDSFGNQSKTDIATVKWTKTDVVDVSFFSIAKMLDSVEVFSTV